MQKEVVKESIGDLVSLSLVKKNLRVEDDFNEEDDLIELYVDGAYDQVEKFIERPIRLQTTVFTLNAGEYLNVEKEGENDCISKVEYQPENESEYVEAPDSTYDVIEDRNSLSIVCKQNVSYRVSITSGYDEGTLPSAIKQAILLLVVESYDRRENAPAYVNTKAKSILNPYRKWRV